MTSKIFIPQHRITPAQITSLKPNEVFVFGSNLKGIHGKGAALTARQWGAELGIVFGLRGQTFAIPTKQTPYESLRVEVIGFYVNRFIEAAKNSPKKIFLVTEIGCNNAGYTPKNIAPLFLQAMHIDNISLPERFWDVLNDPR